MAESLANTVLHRFPPPYRYNRKTQKSELDWDHVRKIMRDLSTPGIDPRKLRTQEEESGDAKKGKGKGKSPGGGGGGGGGGGKGGKEKSGGGKGGKGKKGQTVSKKDAIKATNTLKKSLETADRDMEKLSNLQDPTKLEMDTPTGRLAQSLACLHYFWAMEDKGAAIDVFYDLGLKAEEIKAAAVSKADNVELHFGMVFPNHVKTAYAAYRKSLKAVAEHVGTIEDPIVFQLTQMGDRLVPLNFANYYMGKPKLDPWQNRCLDAIDKGSTVLISAPTSSGKTVLTTYLLAKPIRILFAVPSTPLALQVGSLFLNTLRDTSVWVLCEQMDLVDEQLGGGKMPRVTIGTPEMLETYLERLDPAGIDALVIDEVHNMNENSSMERLIHLLPNTQLLALSATCANTEQLKGWLGTLRSGRVHVEVVTKRFFNQQQYRFTAGAGLVPVSPCAGLTLGILNGPEVLDVAFTPLDTYNLWRALEPFCPELNPHDRLRPDPPAQPSGKGGKGGKAAAAAASAAPQRMSLQQVKEYGRDLVAALRALPEDAQTQVLAAFELVAEAGDADAEGSAPPAGAPRLEALVPQMVESLAVEQMPALCFNLNPHTCKDLFDELLRTLEEQEKHEFPDRAEALMRRQEKYQLAVAQYKKDLERMKNEDVRAAWQRDNPPPRKPEGMDSPHPKYVLKHAHGQLPPDVVDDLKASLSAEFRSKWKKYSQLHKAELTLLYRALRRGFALYTEQMPVVYLRHVQQLAQRGLLSVVFSDKQLSHGINMPFKTCVFCGDSPALDPLMAAQMAGRAGRRGLDRAGHVVYMGLRADRIKTLMTGTLRAVTGSHIAQPAILSMPALPDRDALVASIFDRSLGRYTGARTAEPAPEPAPDAAPAPAAPPREQAEALMALVPAEHQPLVWQLRDYPEAFALAAIIVPKLLDHRELHQRDTDFEDLQLFNYFSRFIRTEAAAPGAEALAWDELPDVWNALLEDTTATLAASPGILASLALPPAVDQSVYLTFKNNGFSEEILANRDRRRALKTRIWDACEILLAIRNLYRSTSAEPLLRAVFRRLWYILLESKF